MTDRDNRQIMIRPETRVEAIPPALLREVYGLVTPDPRVEFLVLSFEYWLQGGATPSLQRREMLKLLPHNLNENNAYRLVSLLAKRGIADDFFDLASPSVDRDGAFRQLLLANGIIMETIRYYASWNGINPREFLNGFLFGVAESAASVVVDLLTLADLIRKAWAWQLRGLFLLATDPAAALDDFWSQVTLVGQAFDGLMQHLDPSKLPALLVKTWQEWNATFERHLENLDAFAAGRVLGKLGGDLWQMLTGIVALVKLLRVAGRAALQYAPLLLGRARAIAAEAAVVLADLVKALRALGRGVVDELAQVGLAALTTLFPPRLLRQLVKEGRALLTYGELTVFPVFDEGYALAFAGARMRAPYAVAMVEQGKPMAMAVMSDRLPAAGGGGLRGRAMASVDETLDQLDDLFRERTAPKASLSQQVVAAQALKLVEQRLSTQLKQLVNKVTYEAFRDLRKSKRRFSGADLGNEIHRRMAQQVGALVKGASPGLAAHTEQSLRTIYAELAANGKIKQTLALDGKKALDQTIASFVARRPDLMDYLGIPTTPAARTPGALGKTLRERFGWKADTTLGDLKCDLLLVDAEAKRVINVDWTSSTKSELFEQTWGKIVDDLKGGFSGDPDKVAAAYREAFKGNIPKEVQDGLERLTRHAVRETVIRQAALEEALGALWPVRSYEIFYDGLAKLWASVSRN